MSGWPERSLYLLLVVATIVALSVLPRDAHWLVRLALAVPIGAAVGIAVWVGVFWAACRLPSRTGQAVLRALFQSHARLTGGRIGIEDAAILSHREVEAKLPDAHASVYYAYAARLFNEGHKEDAVLWFYVGQLRFRFELAAHPDSDPSGGAALLASLNHTVGALVNEWAARDVDLWVRQIDRALEWDAEHPNGVTSRTTSRREYEEVRAGLTRLREEILSRADEYSARS